MAHPVSQLSLSTSLDLFLRQCDSTIGTLNYALGEEIYDGEASVSSFLKNSVVATQSVERLEKEAQKINALIARHKSSHRLCLTEDLDENFSGKSIRKAESKKWSFLSYLMPLHGTIASLNTAASIHSVLERIRNVEEQAQAMYNCLNPTAQRKTPCCREFWLYFRPIVRVTHAVVDALLSESKSTCSSSSAKCRREN